MIVELFSGARGSGIGIARALPGVPSVGLEKDADSCATSAAAGMPAIRCDVEHYPPAAFGDRVTGLWASPPCTDFSQAGKRAGVDGETGRLIYEAHLWASKLWPDWLIFEQVPSVLPYWRRFARDFASRGYSTWAGILNSADYGVPQTRERAFLLASRLRHVGPPPPTHAKHPHPVMFGEPELPWVNMAEALGWEMQPAWEQVRAYDDEVRRFDSAKPAPTVCGARKPAWLPFVRLNTHRDQREDGSTQIIDGTIRVTLEELAVLQDFPEGWPFVGNKTSRARQIGNAVPPALAEACVRAVS